MEQCKSQALGWLCRLALASLLALFLQGRGLAADQPDESATRGYLTVWPEPKPMPEVTFVDGLGARQSLTDFQGKVVLLNVWATWCSPCREEMPTLDRLQGQLG
ncbi:TlpA family protein disulfide reductase, partial [Pseudomonas sp. CrR25]|nr:TlpA family protein disulfide reductase [Pseudomonas sp. CrR25]